MGLKGALTREQAVAITGESAVAAVERLNCEPTGRLGYNGAQQGDALCEWSASVRCVDSEGSPLTLLVYYYTTNAQDRIMTECEGDGSVIEWEIEGYEVL